MVFSFNRRLALNSTVFTIDYSIHSIVRSNIEGIYELLVTSTVVLLAF